MPALTKEENLDLQITPSYWMTSTVLVGSSYLQQQQQQQHKLRCIEPDYVDPLDDKYVIR